MIIKIEKLEIDVPASDLAILPREFVQFVLEQTRRAVEEEQAAACKPAPEPTGGRERGVPVPAALLSELRRMSRAALALRLGVTQTTVSRYLKTGKMPQRCIDALRVE